MRIAGLILVCASVFWLGLFVGQTTVEVPTERTVYIDYRDYRLSSNTTMSFDYALAILATVKYNHIWWAAHPELQDRNTGNTTFNDIWVKDYQGIEDLLKWQQNRIMELER